MKPLIALIIILAVLVCWNGYRGYSLEKKFGKIINAIQRENKIIEGE